MSTFTLPFSGGDTLTLPSGAKFYLLDTTYPVDVDFLSKSGTKLQESAENVEAGFWSAPKGGFGRVKISSATAQTVRVLITRGDAGFDRVFGGKNAYYDRNAQMYTMFMTGTYAPHASTVRGEYTVPSGKKALLLTCNVALERKTAPTTVGTVMVSVYAYPAYNPQGNNYFTWSRTRFTTGTVGDYRQKNDRLDYLLNSGDVVRFSTIDDSVGGDCWYDVYIPIMEFDA